MELADDVRVGVGRPVAIGENSHNLALEVAFHLARGGIICRDYRRAIERDRLARLVRPKIVRRAVGREIRRDAGAFLNEIK